MGDERAAEEAAAAATAVSLRVVAAAAWHVIRGRRFSDFPRVLSFLESLAEAAPELVPFQHLAKLRLGLQAKVGELPDLDRAKLLGEGDDGHWRE